MYTRCGMTAGDLPVLYRDRSLEVEIWEVLDSLEERLKKGQPGGVLGELGYRVGQSAVGKVVVVERG